MAVNLTPEQKESTHSSPEKAKDIDKQSPDGLSDSRMGVAGVLAEGGEDGESAESEGNVSEVAAESSERKGDGIAKGSKKKKDNGDDSKSGSSTGDEDDFVFDEHNLPEAPLMIKKIEKVLRKEIHELQKEAKKHSGGIFRKANYTKYSEAMSEIRKKNILLSRLLGMAKTALKNLFVQMFKPKKAE